MCFLRAKFVKNTILFEIILFLQKHVHEKWHYYIKYTSAHELHPKKKKLNDIKNKQNTFWIFLLFIFNWQRHITVVVTCMLSSRVVPSEIISPVLPIWKANFSTTISVWLTTQMRTGFISPSWAEVSLQSMMGSSVMGKGEFLKESHIWTMRCYEQMFSCYTQDIFAKWEVLQIPHDKFSTKTNYQIKVKH